MTQTTFWTAASIDWNLLQDDYQSASFIAPWIMWKSPEEAKKYVIDTINEDIIEERQYGFDADGNLLPEVAERGHTKEDLWEDTLETIEWIERSSNTDKIYWEFTHDNGTEWTVYPITLEGDET